MTLTAISLNPWSIGMFAVAALLGLTYVPWRSLLSVAWPVAAPSEPTSRTAIEPAPVGVGAYIKAIEDAAPGALPEFVLEQARMGATLFEVQRNWIAKLEETKGVKP